MSADAAGSSAGARAADPAPGWLGAYFWSDGNRRAQSVLGLLWLLDGGLQFQSFMYSHGFLRMLLDGAAGQPNWLHASITWAVHLANGNLAVFNTLFGLVQVLLGLGLLYRPLVRPAIVASLGWVVIVWWFGEAFGMLFMNMAQPLTGAPGGVLMYGLIGLLVWPSDRPGGLLGIRGAKTLWAALWIVMAWLWLLAANSSANATKSMLTSVPSGIHALDSVQNSLASASSGHGLVIALVLAVLSAAIGLAVAAEWHPRGFLIAAIALNVVYSVIPQALGGIFAGGATDPNSGPLFVLLACVMLGVIGRSVVQAPASPAG
jgi:hypothetical protein